MKIGGEEYVLRYEVDLDSKYTLYNWVTRFNLSCSPYLTISLFGMVFFFGFTLSTFVAPRLNHFYGPRKLFLAGMAINLVIKILTLLLPNAWPGTVPTMYLLLFVNGTMQIPRLMSGQIYMCDFLPRANQSFCIAAWQAIDSSVFIIVSIAYWKVTRNSQNLILMSIAQNLLFLLVATLCLP